MEYTIWLLHQGFSRLVLGQFQLQIVQSKEYKAKSTYKKQMGCAITLVLNDDLNVDFSMNILEMAIVNFTHDAVVGSRWTFTNMPSFS